jgi:ADP-ribose pyrophosphatase YjhB (NUDIX family)
MVQQQGSDDPHPYWVLPGGLVEDGELLTEALVREAYEESGVRVEQIAHLAYWTQIDHPQRAAQTIALAFEVQTWSGTLGAHDPDGEILQVELVALAEALARLQAITWRGMREPLLAYLRGECPAGAFWQYREHAGDQECVGCLSLMGDKMTR